jgi:hypothetical protein
MTETVQSGTEHIRQSAEPISYDDLALVGTISRLQNTHAAKEAIGDARLARVQELMDKEWTGQELGEAYGEYLEGIARQDELSAEETLLHAGHYGESGIEYLLKKSLGEDTEDRTLTPEYMAERKRFVEAVVAHARSLPRGETSSKFARQFYNELCSMSPNILSYVGTAADSVDLASTIASVPEMADIYRAKVGETVYDLAFLRNPEAVGEQLSDTFAEAPVDKQLRMLRTFRSIARYGGSDMYEDAINAVKVVNMAVDRVGPSRLSGLVDRAALSVLNETNAILRGQNTRDADDMDSVAYELEQFERSLSSSIQFDEHYKGAHTPSYVAKGVIGARDRWGAITALAPRPAESDQSGEVVPTPLDEYIREAGIECTDEELRTFQEVHRPELRAYLEWQMGGIKFEDIDMQTQIRLLHFASHADTDRFYRLLDGTGGLDEKSRPQFLETFLATEFGDDFGESILTINEKLPEEVAVEVFDMAGEYRKQSKKFASWFASYDPGFAKATERAMNERLTDSLVALETLAVGGKLDAQLGPGGHFELSSAQEALEIMRLQKGAMQTIQDVITDPHVETSHVTEENGKFMMYRFVSEAHGQALLYVRPEGAKGYDSRFEYGNEQGVEASISFIANPVDPHDLLTEKDPDGVSIRFDREGRKTDESPFSEDRDPTRHDGSISLDMSSILGKEGTPGARIGKFIAAGNVLRAAKNGGFEALNHNNNHFDQEKYGTTDGFAGLANYIMRQAEAQIELQRQGRRRSQFGRRATAAARRSDLTTAA